MSPRAVNKRVAIRRAVAGRTLIAAGVLTGAAWFLSRWYILWLWCDRSGTTTGFGIGRGLFGIRRFDTYPTDDWNYFALDPLPTAGWHLWQWSPQPTGFTHFALSIWPLALALTVIGAALLTWARRERAAAQAAAPAASSVRPMSLRPRGGKRIVAGAALVLAGVLIALGWAASSLWTLEVQRRGSSLQFSSGLLTVTSGRSVNERTRWRWDTRPPTEPPFYWQATQLPAPAPLLPGRPGMFPMLPPSLITTEEWKLWVIGGYTQSPERVRMLAAWPVPILLLLCGAAMLWSGLRTRRRTFAGRCAACGYDRVGLLDDSPCPECGKVPGRA